MSDRALLARLARGPASGATLAAELGITRSAVWKRIEALRLAEIFRANVIDASTEHFVFEVTGRSSKVEQFIQIMTELGLVEVSRTGVAAIGRGPASL